MRHPDHEILSLLTRIQPATVQDLCDALQVTATAVRQRLLRLTSEDLVSKQVERRDRGRPCHLYCVTDAGLKVLGDDHAEIAGILWRAVLTIDSVEVRQQVLEQVKCSLIERFGTRQGTQDRSAEGVAGRLQAMCEQLTDKGFDLEIVDETGPGELPILREHNCPYHELVSEDPSFCELEREVFSELIGAPLELTSCRLDGERCCEFEVGVG